MLLKNVLGFTSTEFGSVRCMSQAACVSDCRLFDPLSLSWQNDTTFWGVSRHFQCIQSFERCDKFALSLIALGQLSVERERRLRTDRFASLQLQLCVSMPWQSISHHRVGANSSSLVFAVQMCVSMKWASRCYSWTVHLGWKRVAGQVWENLT